MAASMCSLFRKFNFEILRKKPYSVLYKHKLRFHRQLAIDVKQSQNGSGSSESSSESDMDGDPRKIKLEILDEALKYVPEHGWSKKAIVAGAEALGLPGVAHGMLEKGGADLVLYFNYSCNRKLESILKDRSPPDSNQQSNLDHTSFLFDALKTRLGMNIPYIPKWPEAMALMALPQHALSDIEHVLDLVDTIWFHAGDKSVYVKWYTRRLSLAGMYKLSELYLCQDSSEEYRNTWDFVEERVQSILDTDASISETQSGLNALKEVCEGTGITKESAPVLIRLAIKTLQAQRRNPGLTAGWGGVSFSPKQKKL